MCESNLKVNEDGSCEECAEGEHVTDDQERCKQIQDCNTSRVMKQYDSS